MNIEDIWEGADGRFYFIDENGQGGRVDYGWQLGCQKCGAYKDQIAYLQKQYGDLEACKFALAHLAKPKGQHGDYLCQECLEEE